MCCLIKAGFINQHKEANIFLPMLITKCASTPTLLCLLSAAASWASIFSCILLQWLTTSLRTTRGLEVVEEQPWSLFWPPRASVSLCRARKGSLTLYLLYRSWMNSSLRCALEEEEKKGNGNLYQCPRGSAVYLIYCNRLSI